jgi:uncharacterized protein YgiM (DUF1202 family)
MKMLLLKLFALTAIFLLPQVLLAEDYCERGWSKSFNKYPTPRQINDASNGFVVKSGPCDSSHTIKTGFGKVFVVGYLDVEGVKYYMSQWSYNQATKGKDPNWIVLQSRNVLKNNVLQSQTKTSVPKTSGGIIGFSVINVSTNDVLNMRKSASGYSRKVGKIPHDEDCVASLDETRSRGKQKWVRVSYKGTQGWVNSRYLHSHDRLDWVDICSENYKVANVNSDDVLNMRQSPNYRSKKVGRISPDQDCLIVLDKNNKKWFLVMQNESNSRGWVNSYYLRKSSSCSLPPGKDGGGRGTCQCVDKEYICPRGHVRKSPTMLKECESLDNGSFICLAPDWCGR